MCIRKAVYWRAGQPVTLAYVACIGDDHPEAGAEPPNKTATPVYFAGERRAAVMTDGRIRRVLGKDREHSERLRDKIGFEAVSRRILREGF